MTSFQALDPCEGCLTGHLIGGEGSRVQLLAVIFAGIAPFHMCHAAYTVRLLCGEQCHQSQKTDQHVRLSYS